MLTRMPKGTMPNPSSVPLHLPAIVQSGVLSSLDAAAKDIIVRHMKTLALKAGQRAFRAGDAASHYMVLKDGALKVSVTTELGREIVLYRVEAGESCVLTTACLLSGNAYEAEAVAEADSEAVILPKATFDELMASSARFRHFVFSSYGDRLHTLIGIVQEVALKHLDRRLARLLLQRAQEGVVEATHQALAQDLNTAREVVTRLLHDFSERGWLDTSRGRIVLHDESALEKISARV